MGNLIEDTLYWKNRPLDDTRKDWNEDGNWIEGYKKSASHPHRQVIIDALKDIPFVNLLEVGCAVGANLSVINKEFPDAILQGIDINKDAVYEGSTWFSHNPSIYISEGNILDLAFADKSFDVVLADAVLMYLDPLEIGKALDEMSRVARKAIIIIDWFDKDPNGVIKDFHWARNYDWQLENRGFKVESRKLTEKEWPAKGWINNGYLFMAIRK